MAPIIIPLNTLNSFWPSGSFTAVQIPPQAHHGWSQRRNPQIADEAGGLGAENLNGIKHRLFLKIFLYFIYH
jgi:hypothetical protein